MFKNTFTTIPYGLTQRLDLWTSCKKLKEFTKNQIKFLENKYLKVQIKDVLNQELKEKLGI